MSLLVKDANKNTQQLKTTLDNGEHVAHHIIDSISGDNIDQLITHASASAKSLEQIASGSLTTTQVAPKKVLKTLFSSVETPKKFKNINWSNELSGTFRLTTYDPTRKYISVYNNSNSDLYISISDEENTSFTVDFVQGRDPEQLTFSFELEAQGQNPIEVFKFTTQQLKNRYTYFTQTHLDPTDTRKYGSNISYSTEKIGQLARVKIALTPEYSYANLQKYQPTPGTVGKFVLKMPEVGTLGSPGYLPAAHTYFICDEVSNKKCYTKCTETLFDEDSEEVFEPNYLNGFTLDSKTTPPINFSYNIKGGESIIVWEPEVVFGFYGFFAEVGNELDVNLTEGF